VFAAATPWTARRTPEPEGGISPPENRISLVEKKVAIAADLGHFAFLMQFYQRSSGIVERG
jgi:hypothetical protein